MPKTWMRKPGWEKWDGIRRNWGRQSFQNWVNTVKSLSVKWAKGWVLGTSFEQTGNEIKSHVENSSKEKQKRGPNLGFSPKLVLICESPPVSWGCFACTNVCSYLYFTPSFLDLPYPPEQEFHPQFFEFALSTIPSLLLEFFIKISWSLSE